MRRGSHLTPPVLHQIRQNPYRASTVWGKQTKTNVFWSIAFRNIENTRLGATPDTPVYPFQNIAKQQVFGVLPSEKYKKYKVLATSRCTTPKPKKTKFVFYVFHALIYLTPSLASLVVWMPPGCLLGTQ